MLAASRAIRSREATEQRFTARAQLPDGEPIEFDVQMLDHIDEAKAAQRLREVSDVHYMQKRSG